MLLSIRLLCKIKLSTGFRDKILEWETNKVVCKLNNDALTRNSFAFSHP